MLTAGVEKIAEAVLYEGYLLFPYRRSAMKNQQRWTFGSVYPRDYSEEAGGVDPWLMQTQCLVEGDAATEIDIKVRCLHVVERKVTTNGSGLPSFVDELRVDGHIYRPWEEAIERDLVVQPTDNGSPLRLEALCSDRRTFAIDIPAGRAIETLFSADREEAGALVRDWRPIRGAVELSAERLEIPRNDLSNSSDHSDPSVRSDTDISSTQRSEIPAVLETAPGADAGLYRVTTRIVNTTPWPAADHIARTCNDAVRHTFISTHTILRVHGGEFVSLLEPPEQYTEAAGVCENIKTWPVLVGEPGDRDTILSSPIILYDYPQISPESQGNYFDATEIDELLALTVLTLTDDEKQEMRESDIHALEILERTESLSEEQLMKMHGVVRYLQPARGNDQ